MALGVEALAVGAVAEDHRGGGRAAPATLLAHVGPQPRGARAPAPGIEHRHRGIVGVQARATEDVALQRLTERGEQRARRPHPVGERGALDVNALAGVDLGLAVERQVIAVLRDEHLGEQPRAGKPAGDGPLRGRRLHHRRAGAAALLRAHVADHPEGGRHVLEHLRDVLAEGDQHSAAARAGAGASWRWVSRGRCAGSARGVRGAVSRLDLVGFAAAAASSAGSPPSASMVSSSCAICACSRSEERPNCIRRNFASCRRSRSSSSAWRRTVACEAASSARLASSSSRSAAASAVSSQGVLGVVAGTDQVYRGG